jgi:methylated-DNA-[protein]-cysteine S-methyltransferase
LNHFQFPVSFGTVLIFWNDDGLVTQIKLCAERLLKSQRRDVPVAAAFFIDRLEQFFFYGEPVGEIPWEFLDQSQCTAFQKAVYSLIVTIPHGETRTYGWVAQQLGKKAASRAVGQALKKNHFPIIIPCHRIVGMHSAMGFMGEQDPRHPLCLIKQKLISLEEEYLNPVFSFLPQMIAKSEVERYSIVV